MSVLEVNETPSIYKLEKFIIVDDDSVSYPWRERDYLSCCKIYTTVDNDGNAIEVVDVSAQYAVSRPRNLVDKQGPQTSYGTGEEYTTPVEYNTLICPPYVKSEVLEAGGDVTWNEQFDGMNPLSIIYATRLRVPMTCKGRLGEIPDGETYWNDRENVTSTREAGGESKDVVAYYKDVNIDGRVLKTSSQTHKSNNVDMGDIINRENDEERLDDMMQACITNEDAAIEYITDIDKVTVEGTPASSETQKYAIVLHARDGSAAPYNYEARLETISGGSGADTFDELGDTFGTPINSGTVGQLMSIVNESGKKLKQDWLTAKNFEPTNSESKKGKYFAVAENNTDDIRLMEMHNLVDDDDSIGIKKKFEHLDTYDYFLTIDNEGTYFKKLAYIDQLQYVTIDAEETDVGEGETYTGILHPKVDKVGVEIDGITTISHSFTYQKAVIDDIVPASTDEDKFDVYDSYYVYQEKAGAVKLKKFPGSFLDAKFAASGSGGTGAGMRVRWYSGTDELVLFSSDSQNLVGTEGNPSTVDKDANNNEYKFKPVLFGICKDDTENTYEYRYFLATDAFDPA